MYQVAALGVTLVLSITGGLLSGFIVSNCLPGLDHYFDDEEHMHDVKFDNPLEDVSEAEKEEDKQFDAPPKINAVN